MFFITNGTLLYMKKDYEELQRVHAGHWVCEFALWVTWAHLGTLRAATHCNAAALDVRTFHLIASEFHGSGRLYPSQYATMITLRLGDAMKGARHSGSELENL